MNRKDLTILSYLRKNARSSLTKMSRKTKIPVSTIFDKIKSFENKIITKHTTLLDFSKLGYSTRAFIKIKCNRDDKEELSKFFQNSSYINSIFKITNGYDFMIEGIFKDLMEMENFIDKLEEKYKLEQIQSCYVIKEIKRENFLSDIIKANLI